MARLASTGLAAAIVERFADGAEHAIDEVVATCDHLIPPEIAVREYDRKLRRKTDRTVREKVELARRWRIREVLRNLGAEPRGDSPRRIWVRFVLPVGQYGYRSGETHHHSKLTEPVVSEIKRRLRAKEKQKAIALDYGVVVSAISAIACGRAWRNVE